MDRHRRELMRLAAEVGFDLITYESNFRGPHGRLVLTLNGRSRTLPVSRGSGTRDPRSMINMRSHLRRTRREMEG